MSQQHPPVVFTDWTGRDDGPGTENARWFNTVTVAPTAEVVESEPGTVLVGFASDEGVRRNSGRPGAAGGPAAIRAAMGSFALQSPGRLYDVGDLHPGRELEAGQSAFGEIVAALQDAGHRTIGVGGGHEITWASYLGVAGAAVHAGKKLGILNLDAHFDNREAEVATSGTGFFQIAEVERAAGRDMHAAAIGIAEQANTKVLFDRAEAEGLTYLLDTDCGIARLDTVLGFVDEFLAGIDALYLTVDLDVLPAATAPGVSAPAARGVCIEVIEAILHRVADSGKLVHADVAELNPDFDIDQRTARVAGRIIHTLSTH